jgi:hypothetical protein
MMHDRPMESYGNKFRDKVPALRECYLEKTIPELTAMLREESQTPIKRFWDTHERMNNIEKILRTCLDGHSRSRKIR